ncbi:hypothetical protein [Occallatibacter riparius]|uniref:Uncharacterized protein n=1 Tax=Occallatibacter riparius TaxID=1002689 RepID=A0A9J7BRT2_9BACT|nr:hypothetical protein [Occallatibacter riparius]UWZ85279.1 hypothetical protein MOP44_04895 [Occallatibacter riparius]
MVSKNTYNKVVSALDAEKADNIDLRRTIQDQGRTISDLERKLEHSSAQNSGSKDASSGQPDFGTKEGVFRFLESGPVLAALGIVGPLMIPLSKLFLALPAACFALGFHRSQVVAAKGLAVKVAGYFLILCLGSLAGYGAHKALQETESELISRIQDVFNNIFTKPSVTNIYPQTVVNHPAATPDVRRPWVVLRFKGLHGDMKKQLTSPHPGLEVEEEQSNGGDAIAKSVSENGDLFFGPPGTSTEDLIFNRLKQQPFGSPAIDILPGKEYAQPLVVGHPGSPIDLDPTNEPADTGNKLFDGKYMIYVAVYVSYRDRKGKLHSTEQCLVGTNLMDDMRYCLGHNQMN